MYKLYIHTHTYICVCVCVCAHVCIYVYNYMYSLLAWSDRRERSDSTSIGFSQQSNTRKICPRQNSPHPPHPPITGCTHQPPQPPIPSFCAGVSCGDTKRGSTAFDLVVRPWSIHLLYGYRRDLVRFGEICNFAIFRMAFPQERLHPHPPTFSWVGSLQRNSWLQFWERFGCYSV